MTITKRKEYIGWDQFFMGVAAIAAMRSKDPHTRSGACIVHPTNHKILGVGYNGLPYGCDDDKFPWERTADRECDTKYAYIIHAERNAIDNAVADLAGAVLYLYSDSGYYPCATCAQGIAQKGLKEVVIGFIGDSGSERYRPDVSGNIEATKRILDAAGVKIRVIGADLIKMFLGLSSQFLDSSNMVLHRSDMGAKPDGSGEVVESKEKEDVR